MLPDAPPLHRRRDGPVHRARALRRRAPAQRRGAARGRARAAAPTTTRGGPTRNPFAAWGERLTAGSAPPARRRRRRLSRLRVRHRADGRLGVRAARRPRRLVPGRRRRAPRPRACARSSRRPRSSPSAWPAGGRSTRADARARWPTAWEQAMVRLWRRILVAPMDLDDGWEVAATPPGRCATPGGPRAAPRSTGSPATRSRHRGGLRSAPTAGTSTPRTGGFAAASRADGDARRHLRCALDGIATVSRGLPQRRAGAGVRVDVRRPRGRRRRATARPTTSSRSSAGR